MQLGAIDNQVKVGRQAIIRLGQFLGKIKVSHKFEFDRLDIRSVQNLTYEMYGQRYDLMDANLWRSQYSLGDQDRYDRNCQLHLGRYGGSSVTLCLGDPDSNPEECTIPKIVKKKPVLVHNDNDNKVAL